MDTSVAECLFEIDHGSGGQVEVFQESVYAPLLRLSSFPFLASSSLVFVAAFSSQVLRKPPPQKNIHADEAARSKTPTAIKLARPQPYGRSKCILCFRKERICKAHRGSGRENECE